MAVQLHSREHNRTVLSDLQVGDLIEFPRGYYSHWGVFVGRYYNFHCRVNYIGHGGVIMVSVFASSAVDRGFEPILGQTKDYNNKLVFVTSQLST